MKIIFLLRKLSVGGKCSVGFRSSRKLKGPKCEDDDVVVLAKFISPLLIIERSIDMLDLFDDTDDLLLI